MVLSFLVTSNACAMQKEIKLYDPEGSVKKVLRVGTGLLGLGAGTYGAYKEFEKGNIQLGCTYASIAIAGLLFFRVPSFSANKAEKEADMVTSQYIKGRNFIPDELRELADDAQVKESYASGMSDDILSNVHKVRSNYEQYMSQSTSLWGRIFAAVRGKTCGDGQIHAELTEFKGKSEKGDMTIQLSLGDAVKYLLPWYVNSREQDMTDFVRGHCVLALLMQAIRRRTDRCWAFKSQSNNHLPIIRVVNSTPAIERTLWPIAHYYSVKIDAPATHLFNPAAIKDDGIKEYADNLIGILKRFYHGNGLNEDVKNEKFLEALEQAGISLDDDWYYPVLKKFTTDENYRDKFANCAVSKIVRNSDGYGDWLTVQEVCDYTDLEAFWNKIDAEKQKEWIKLFREAFGKTEQEGEESSENEKLIQAIISQLSNLLDDFIIRWQGFSDSGLKDFYFVCNNQNEQKWDFSLVYKKVRNDPSYRKRIQNLMQKTDDSKEQKNTPITVQPNHLFHLVSINTWTPAVQGEWVAILKEAHPNAKEAVVEEEEV